MLPTFHHYTKSLSRMVGGLDAYYVFAFGEVGESGDG